MSALKKYTSFEALKQNAKTSNTDQARDSVFSEFEAFVKQLQKEYSAKKKTATDNGKQPNR